MDESEEMVGSSSLSKLQHQRLRGERQGSGCGSTQFWSRSDNTDLTVFTGLSVVVMLWNIDMVVINRVGVCFVTDRTFRCCSISFD